MKEPSEHILNFPADQAFGRYKQFFPDEAIAHPAKACASMIEWIILRYTKEGDVIIDPMAGTFSTCVIAALNNRNGVGVELEDKFYGWGLEAKKRVERTSTLTPKGRMVVLKGDARELTKVLKKNADAVVFSPPYIGTEPAHDLDFQKKRQLQGKLSKGNVLAIYKHQDSLDNISSFPYGTLPDGGFEIDAVVFSPPYAESPRGGGIAVRGYIKNGKHDDVHLRHSRPYSDSPDDIGNMPYGEADTVIFSPPYSEICPGGKTQVPCSPEEADYTDKRAGRKGTKHEFTKWYIRDKYSKNPKNIGNLPHGKIDSVIFSPPYSESMSKKRKGYTTRPELSKTRHMGEESNDNNIGNLQHGNIDAIVASPPYSETYSSSKAGKAIRTGKTKIHDEKRLARPYTKNLSKQNIGNLSHGNVDAIITSPPYSEGIGHKQGEFGKYTPDEIKQTKSYKQKVELAKKHELIKSSKENIGALRHGKIDAIVTSPPYEGQVAEKGDGILSRREERVRGAGFDPKDYMSGHLGKDWKYSDGKNNIGNLKADTYLGAMLQVYRECFKVLKSGGVMVLITKNFIRQKKIVRLDLDTIKLCEAAGFKFVERWYRKLEHPSFWRIIYAKKFHYCPQCTKVYRVRKVTSDKLSMTECLKCNTKLEPMLIKYEDILVFKKID